MIWTDRIPCYRPTGGSESFREYDNRWWRVLLARRVELARLEAEAWEYRWRFETGYLSGIEACLRDQLDAAEHAIRFAHEEFRLAPVTIRLRKYFEAQISTEAPVVWDVLPAVKRLFPWADGRDR